MNQAGWDWDGFIMTVAGSYFVDGFDRDDMLQEGRLAALQAIATHDQARLPLATWVGIVVSSKFKDLLTRSRREKRRAVVMQLRDDLDAPSTVDQAELLMQLRDIARRMERLTPLERRAIVAIACGYRYDELGLPEKAVDNAAQRGRRKLRDVA